MSIENTNSKIFDQLVMNFLNQYYYDSNFRAQQEKDYNENPNAISPLEMYAMEKVIGYGNKHYMDKLIAKFSNIQDETIIKEIIKFIVLYQDETFREIKLRQFYDAPQTLSLMEMALIKSAEAAMQIRKAMGQSYDDYFEIDVSSDEAIKATRLNLFIGQFIMQVLGQPESKEIRDRQKAPGQVSSLDKPTLLSYISAAIKGQEKQTEAFLDQELVRFLYQQKLGKNYFADNGLYQYRTNITFQEVASFRENQEARIKTTHSDPDKKN